METQATGRSKRQTSADHVIDYKVEDFTQNGQQYNLILAVNGYHPISDYLRALSPDGIYVVAGGSILFPDRIIA